MNKIAPNNEYSGPNGKGAYQVIYNQQAAALPSNISRSKGNSTKTSPKTIKIKINNE